MNCLVSGGKNETVLPFRASSPFGIQGHEFQDHNQIGKRVKCPTCGQDLYRNDQAEVHLTQHEDRGESPRGSWKKCFRWCICGHRTIQKSNLKAHMKSCKKLSAHRATTSVANQENDEPSALPSNEAAYNTYPDVVEENLHIAIRPLHDCNIHIPSPHARQVHVARPGDGDLSGHSLIIHRSNIEQDHTVYNPFGFASTPLGQTLPRDSGSGPHYQPRYEEFSLVHRYSTLPLPIPDEGGRHRTTNDFPLLGYAPAYHGEYQYQFSW